MAQTVMIALARAEGLEPSTLGFGGCCFVNENSENACKLPENVQRTRAQSANRDLHRFAVILAFALAACGGGGGAQTIPQTPLIQVIDPTPPDPEPEPEKTCDTPIVGVATGQSNMLGSNNDTSGSVVTDESVQVWDWSLGHTGEFTESVPNVYPPYGDTYVATNNLAHLFSIRMHEETGCPVYLIIRAQGSQSITHWTGPEPTE